MLENPSIGDCCLGNNHKGGVHVILIVTVLDAVRSLEDARRSMFELLRLTPRQAESAATIDWSNDAYPMPYMAIRSRNILKQNVNCAGTLLKVPTGSRIFFLICIS